MAFRLWRERIEKGISVSETKGKIEEIDVLTPYLEKILGDVKLARPMKIAIDCGNGVTGPTALELFKRLGCEVTPLYAEIDGHFPNHHPDPSKPANLVDLIATVKQRMWNWVWHLMVTETAWVW